jgi:serine/threonine-protein kinase
LITVRSIVVARGAAGAAELDARVHVQNRSRGSVALIVTTTCPGTHATGSDVVGSTIGPNPISSGTSADGDLYFGLPDDGYGGINGACTSAALRIGASIDSDITGDRVGTWPVSGSLVTRLRLAMAPTTVAPPSTAPPTTQAPVTTPPVTAPPVTAPPPTSPPVTQPPVTQPPAPAGATAICNDGTYSYAQHRRGACSHHGGVRQWLINVPA